MVRAKSGLGDSVHKINPIRALSHCILWLHDVGFLNMTLNLIELEGAPALILQWEEPSWDVRNLTRAVGINCTDTSQEILEIRNVSDYEIILTELNFNVTIVCCSVPITIKGNGSVICEESSLAEKMGILTIIVLHGAVITACNYVHGISRCK